MKLLKLRKAQSLIEYAILLAIVISAFLLLQGIVKRGVSGGLNESASRMGDQYSVTNTATQEARTMDNAEQIITEETGTSKDEDLVGILGDVGMGDVPVVGSIDRGAHNITQRLGQDFTSETKSKTESAKLEIYKVSEAQKTEYDDFDSPLGT